MRTRNQQALAGAFLQEFDGLVDALVPAGQHDDRVRARLGRGLQGRDRICKAKETAEDQARQRARRKKPSQRRTRRIGTATRQDAARSGASSGSGRIGLRVMWPIVMSRDYTQIAAAEQTLSWQNGIG